MMYVCKDHKIQNIAWHKLYPEDLDEHEVVPFNAFRDSLSPYWWIPNINNSGFSRWRSEKQKIKMYEYVSSEQFIRDFKEIEKRIMIKMDNTQNLM